MSGGILSGGYCPGGYCPDTSLCIEAWRRHLQGYHDANLVSFLEFGWPINFNRNTILASTHENHASALALPDDLDYNINTELGHQALAGPFKGPPVVPMHLSPLMMRIKKDAQHRRIIMDLSWPPGAASSWNNANTGQGRVHV